MDEYFGDNSKNDFLQLDERMIQQIIDDGAGNSPYLTAVKPQKKRRKSVSFDHISLLEELSPPLSKSSDEDPNDLDTNLKNGTEKKKERTSSQREASKRYRMKKKMMNQHLQEQLDRLDLEKKELQLKNEENEKIIESLKNELNRNRSKDGIGDDQMKNDGKNLKIKEQKNRLVEELNHLYQSGPEENVRAVLEKLYDLPNSKENIGLSLWKNLFGASIPCIMSDAGYFNDPTYTTYLQLETFGISTFVKNIFEILENSLTDQQKSLIEDLAKEYYYHINEIRMEREQKSREIVINFSKNTPKTMKGMVQNAALIESLRSNIAEEVEFFNKSAQSIVFSLRPKQQAQLYLTNEFHYRNIVQMKQMWESLQSL